MNANLELIYNKFRIQLDNRFRHFSDRSGSEDTNRIPRTQDHANAKFIFEFNTVRIARHDSLYGLDTNFSKNEAKHILDISQKFIDKIKTLIP